jgi:colanic acid/amylovoran biosynthesis glycosyltransferase
MPPSLRILVVGVDWPPETFILTRLKSLKQRGIDVALVTSSRYASSSVTEGLRIIRLSRWDDPFLRAITGSVKGALGSMLKRPNSSISVLRATQAHHGWWKGSSIAIRTQIPLLCLEADVVHFEWNLTAAQYLPLFRLWNRPIVISCRGSQINVPSSTGSQAVQRGLKASLEQATAVHCVSEAIAAEAEMYGLKREKTWVIRPAVDTAFFRPPTTRPPPGGTLRVVTTGSLVWQKGYEYCLMAIKQLIESGTSTELNIIGDGPERQRILFTIEDLGLRKHVRLHGRLLPEDVRCLLWKSDAFVLASVSEGISNAVLEAMACGLPVVATDVGGMREVIRDGHNGYLLPARDPAALAAALHRLVEPQVAHSIGAKARLRIKEDFSLESQTDRFIDLYHWALARSRESQ